MVPRHARRIYDKYCARGEPMPVAIVLGVHPAIWFGAGYSTAFGIEELTLSGGLLGRSVRTVACETIPIDVPAEAEVVIEAAVDAGNYVLDEGPFGEVTGTYGDDCKAHVLRVKAITRRRDPIYYALHCGFPSTETQSTTGLGIEVATREHLRNVDGGMIDLLDIRCLTVSGLMMLVLKMRPRYEGQAKTALMAALSGPYQQPKVAVAVDDDIDSADVRQILWSMSTRVRAERDVILIPNVRIWAIDNASTIVPGIEHLQRVGTKWMIDATKPPITAPAERAHFDMAMPLNYDTVHVADFLP
jgi:UbiD family decarboxylase